MRLIYMRVSSESQSFDQQVLALNDQMTGIEGKNYRIVKEIGSGAKYLPKLDELIRNMQPKNTLVISELSRVGRQHREVIKLIEELIEKQVGLYIANNQFLSFKPEEDMDLLKKMVIEMLGYMSEMERTLIKERTARGIQKAREAGRYRIPPKDKQARRDYIEMSKTHKGTNKQLATLMGVSVKTVYRIKRELKDVG